MCWKILLALQLALAGSSGAPAPPSYRGLIKLPLELQAPDGSRLAPGEYDIEVKPAKDRFELIFSQEEHVKATVQDELLKDDASAPPVRAPLLGTHYLRPSDEPIGTDAERQLSKTGRTQYEEENRDWKAALRVYRSEDERQAVFVFEEKKPHGQWTTVIFRLLLAPPAQH